MEDGKKGSELPVRPEAWTFPLEIKLGENEGDIPMEGEGKKA